MASSIITTTLCFGTSSNFVAASVPPSRWIRGNRAGSWGLKGVGRTAFEAALAGRPVVVTLPGAGRSSATVTGEIGIVLEPDDLAGIMEALMGLISSAERRREVGERARSTLGQRHDPQRVAGQVEKVYEDALAKVEWRHPHRDSREAGTAGPQKEQTW